MHPLLSTRMLAPWKLIQNACHPLARLGKGTPFFTWKTIAGIKKYTLISLCIIPFLCRYSNPSNSCFVYVLITCLANYLPKFHSQNSQRCKEKQQELTASGKGPNFPKSDDIDPPGTNSNRIFKFSSSLTVPRYLWGNKTKMTVRKETGFTS